MANSEYKIQHSRNKLFNNIKKLADSQNISLQELAIKLDFSKNLIYRWKKSDPKAKDLEKLADYFNVSVDYLLGRDSMTDTTTPPEINDVSSYLITTIPKNENSSIFDRIKYLSKIKGVSISKLEEKLQFSRGSLYTWKTKSPNSDRLVKVADYFGISVDYLLGRGSEKYIQKSRTTDLAVFIEQNFDDMTFNGKLLDYNEKNKLKLILMLVFNNSYTDLELDQMLSIITNKQRK